MNEDFRDLLAALVAADARFLIVGAHALAAHGLPRATGDLDIWIDRSSNNCDRVWTALIDFGAPLDVFGLARKDLEMPDTVIQLGVPPRRVDILTDLTGVAFDQAWADRMTVELDDLAMPVLGRADLIRNKRATGRLKDRADLEALGETDE